MKKTSTIFLSLLLLTACSGQSNSVNMKILSADFENEGTIPAKYTCDGDDVSPPLTLAEVPEDAESLVIISDDPDAPAGTWVHWLMWNINPATTEFPANSVPTDAVEGTNSFKNIGYGGPCPPSGVHRYYFRVYALDTVLDLPEGSTREALDQAMEGHIIDRGELMAKYSRS
ncbi:YbhB/YbcL family Raf kinase inhibitor-like protein [Candidatus Peregrinibacteria bacterium]|nr:YbhB/YbcL family Raf kinase inhibitor-like protein [Candidatus Peregrinibacteria bacterium]